MSEREHPRADRTRLIRDLRSMATKLRRHSIAMTTEAGSGHPTTCLSCADLLAALFFHTLRYDVKNPLNPHNDRFVLSKGHGAPILYAAWAEAGAFPTDRLLRLRRIDSRLEGHPTPRLPWVDVATGSLGQGLSIGLGMALAAQRDRLGCRVYVLMGDGETAEGSVWEAASLAAHYRVDNLVGIVDVNRLGQSQATMLQHDIESYAERFRAFGWQVRAIDGHDYDQILDAFDEATAAKERPVMILAKTIKGKGVSFLEDKNGWHGRALERGEQSEKALAELRLDAEELDLHMRAPEKMQEPAESGASPGRSIAAPEYGLGEEVATRTAYGTALEKLGRVEPRVVVIDGDVMNSTRTKRFAGAFADRFIEGFIAEQNMVGMAMGIQALGKVPFVTTFACFLSRAFDLIRMAGISEANIKLCGSHAGVSVGPDGPSQMALEDLAMMRTIPGAAVLYPCDAVSAERMVELAMCRVGIVYIRTTRPKTPVIYPNDESFDIGGSKVLRSGSRDQVTVVAAGITVHEALEAYGLLKQEGIAVRVVDCYCVKPVDRRTLLHCASQTNGVLLTVEDHYAEGGLGEAVLSAVGRDGVHVENLAVSRLPRSGAPDALLEMEGIDAAAIAAAVKGLLPQQRAAAAG